MSSTFDYLKTTSDSECPPTRSQNVSQIWSVFRNLERFATYGWPFWFGVEHMCKLDTDVASFLKRDSAAVGREPERRTAAPS